MPAAAAGRMRTADGLAAAVARGAGERNRRAARAPAGGARLRELLRLSYEQIAQVMDVEPAAVAPLLARARLRLRVRAARQRATRAPRRARIGERALRAARPPAGLRAPLTARTTSGCSRTSASCAACEVAHAAMLEASVCYRAWPRERRRVEDVDAEPESMSAPALRLQTSAGVLELGGAPWLMGIVNATPDSFSDAGLHQTLRASAWSSPGRCWPRAREIIDIGGESGRHQPARRSQPQEEIERVVPLIERVSGELGALVSVDTYKPAVARAAIAAGASIVNDVSGLRDPAAGRRVRRRPARRWCSCTRARRPSRSCSTRLWMAGSSPRTCSAFLRERIELAIERGVAFEQLMLDPGPDFAKTPAQTVEVLRALPDLHALGRPLLLAVSRKDFVGAITGRGPRERLAGTLAAVGHGVDAGAHVLRVHDVAEVADFLAVRAVLAGEQMLDSGARIDDSLRWAAGADIRPRRSRRRSIGRR